MLPRKRAFGLAYGGGVLCDEAAAAALGKHEPLALKLLQGALHRVRVDPGVRGQIPHTRHPLARGQLPGNDRELYLIHKLCVYRHIVVKMPFHVLPPCVAVLSD